MHVTFVKKILADGTPCAKCADVEARLRRDGHWSRIDAVVLADERDPRSEGMVLAVRHGVSLAPFFVVTDDRGRTTIYTSYLKLVREIFGGQVDSRAEAQEILDRNPDLDFL